LKPGRSSESQESVMLSLEEPKTRLLHTAGEIFAEKGYHAATVREICQKAGVNIASVSYYFRDKEGLYVESVREAAASCAAAGPLPDWGPDTPPAAKLHGFIRAFLQRVVVNREPSWQGLLIMREIFQPTRACAEFVEAFVRPTFQTLLGVLDELLPAAVPEVKRHLFGFSIIGQCLHYRLNRNVMLLLVGQDEFDSYSVDQLAGHITAFSLAGLKALTRPEGGQP
jgi:AcrR family transcriptional regulator